MTIKREIREKPTLLKRLLNQTKIISIVSISDDFFFKQFSVQHTHTHWHEKQKNCYYFLTYIQSMVLFSLYIYLS